MKHIRGNYQRGRIFIYVERGCDPQYANGEASECFITLAPCKHNLIFKESF